MTTKTRITLTAAATCVAISTPVYFQQREIRTLRKENAALLAAAKPPHNPLAPPPAPASTRTGSVPAADLAGASADDREKPITERTRDLGKRGHSTPTDNLKLSGRLPRTTTGEIAITGDEIADGPALALAGGLTFLPADVRSVPMVAGKVYWDHAQATGAPDTAGTGDKPTAWAPKSSRSGEQ